MLVERRKVFTRKAEGGVYARSIQDLPDYGASNLVKPLATRARTSVPRALVSGAASGSFTVQAWSRAPAIENVATARAVPGG